MKPAHLAPQEIASLLEVELSQVTRWIEQGALPVQRSSAELEDIGVERVTPLALANFLLRQGIDLPSPLRCSVDLLVIDDEGATLRATARLLRRSAPHLNVSLAEGADVGWRDVQQKVPDIVLVDMYMPELSGIDLCARIKESPATSGVQVIGFSGRRDPDLESAFLRAGACSVVDKPPSVEQLLDALDADDGGPRGAPRFGAGDALH